MKILKLGSKNCTGCKIMKPLFEEVEKENPNLQTEYYEIGSSEAEDIIKKYDIEHAPTFVFVDKNGDELDRIIDSCSKDEILEKIDKCIDK